jgi:glycerol uptake facilitator-like aquaporin
MLRGISWKLLAGYAGAQIIGSFAGVACAHLMFGLPPFSASEHIRSGGSQVFSEFVVAFGLLAVIWGVVRSRPTVVPFAVGAYITAAYWFTASTSFANPAVTLARAATNTFVGIRPADTPAFLLAQIGGAVAGTMVFRWLTPRMLKSATELVVPHAEE